ncbi:hypothetical protein [Mesorhizobium sp.]|uniref:hypothetical protein n=1 Tax=Mesorhizobium sp. TaxID=1871066 RepID=UPI000FE79B66|nr:hypothetical protein [Mesorhizobium sp.]RWP02717.1 MAG: hypothetical protein EOQ99_22775 [Mesorhizobium sp.]
MRTITHAQAPERWDKKKKAGLLSPAKYNGQGERAWTNGGDIRRDVDVGQLRQSFNEIAVGELGRRQTLRRGDPGHRSSLSSAVHSYATFEAQIVNMETRSGMFDVDRLEVSLGAVCCQTAFG